MKCGSNEGGTLAEVQVAAHPVAVSAAPAVPPTAPPVGILAPPPVAAPTSIPAGVVLNGRYKLTRLLGQGGMGQVWHALDQVRGGIAVAIKLLPQEAWSDPEAQANLRHEANLSLKLSHPFIVRLINLEPGPPPFLVMEFVDGPNLATLLARRKLEGEGPLTPVQAARWLLDLAGAVDYAQSRGVIHRDIKPSNVLLEVESDGRLVAKLADFGIAAELASFRTRFTGGVPVGTLVYMAPEQVACQRLDGRADVYSLAATAYQMLALAPPFTGGNVAWAIMNAPVPPIDGVPEAVMKVLKDGLAKTPVERPSSATDLAERFAEAVGTPVARINGRLPTLKTPPEPVGFISSRPAQAVSDPAPAVDVTQPDRLPATAPIDPAMRAAAIDAVRIIEKRSARIDQFAQSRNVPPRVDPESSQASASKQEAGAEVAPQAMAQSESPDTATSRPNRPPLPWPLGAWRYVGVVMTFHGLFTPFWKDGIAIACAGLLIICSVNYGWSPLVALLRILMRLWTTVIVLLALLAGIAILPTPGQPSPIDPAYAPWLIGLLSLQLYMVNWTLRHPATRTYCDDIEGARVDLSTYQGPFKAMAAGLLIAPVLCFWAYPEADAVFRRYNDPLRLSSDLASVKLRGATVRIPVPEAWIAEAVSSTRYPRGTLLRMAPKVPPLWASPELFVRNLGASSSTPDQFEPKRHLNLLHFNEPGPFRIAYRTLQAGEPPWVEFRTDRGESVFTYTESLFFVTSLRGQDLALQLRAGRKTVETYGELVWTMARSLIVVN